MPLLAFGHILYAQQQTTAGSLGGTAPAVTGDAAGALVPTVTAESPGEAALADYRAARTPRSISVTLPAPTAATINNALSAAPSAATAAALAIQADTNLTSANAVAAAQGLQLLRPAFLPGGGGVAAPITLTAAVGAAPAAAPIALRFDATRAGARAWVQALDGGTLDGTPGGRWVSLGADGTLAFVFQALAGRQEHFQVSVRLDNVESLLRFHVVDPAQLPRQAQTGAPAAVVAPVPPPSAAPSTATQ